MNWLDIVLLIVIAAAIVAACIYMKRRKKSGKCIGCSGDCSRCGLKSDQ